MQPTLNIAMRAARAAAEKLKFELEQKTSLLESGTSLEDFINRAVDNAAYMITKTIRKAHPNHNILFDETGMDEAKTPDNDALWHVRILDHAGNYLNGYPALTTVIAFELKGQMQHIAMVNPLSGEEVSCSRGRGIHRIEKRIRVSANKKLAGSVVSLNQVPVSHPGVTKLEDEQATLRMTGSLLQDVAYCCSGQTDAVVATGVTEFDMKVIPLLAQESGALISDISGKPVRSSTKELLVSNPKLLKVLVQSFKKI